MSETLKEYSYLGDFHMHTTGSDGLLTPEELVDQIVQEGLLQAIGITDHKTTASALKAKQYAEANNYPLIVIPGIEITASKLGPFGAHIIGLFPEEDIPEDIPSGRPIDWTVEAILDQGGLVILPHPMDNKTFSVGEEGILSILDNPRLTIHGFEVGNSQAGRRANQAAAEIYKRYLAPLGVARLGGTDHHFKNFVKDRWLTAFSGDPKEAIISAQTSEVYRRETTGGIRLDHQLQVGYRGLVLETIKGLRDYFGKTLPSRFPQHQ